MRDCSSSNQVPAGAPLVLCASLCQTDWGGGGAVLGQAVGEIGWNGSELRPFTPLRKACRVGGTADGEAVLRLVLEWCIIICIQHLEDKIDEFRCIFRCMARHSAA